MYKTFLKDYKFRAYGIFVEASNRTGKIQKSTYHPMAKNLNKNEADIKFNYFESVFNKRTQLKVRPNGICIMTKHSNLSTLDIDRPEQCEILRDLLNDCNFVIKTRKGYHLYFNKEDILPRNERNNGIIDINTDNLFYCNQYKVIETDEIFKYEIIKNTGKLSNMPTYAIEYCEKLIKNSIENKTTKEKKTKSTKPNNIIQPDIIIEKFNLETLKSIYDIFYDYDMKNINKNLYKYFHTY